MLPEAIYSAAQLRELERCAVRSGLSEIVLMQRAGRAAWEALRHRWPEANRILVLAGSGNNAGDGYVLAHCAHQAGQEVTVLTVADSTRLKGAAAEARRIYLDSGAPEQSFDRGLPETAHVLVDALLGTGLDRALSDNMLLAVTAINQSPLPVLALDIPSGLHADSGAIMGAAVQADITFTFIALKPGLLTGAGPRCCGQVLFADLGVPAGCYAQGQPCARRLLQGDAPLPKRARDAHKGAFGHVLVMGGDHGMGGAVRLTAEAALRTGAGLVTVATRTAHVSALLAGLPEAMACAVDFADDIAALFERASVIALGPGLGQGAWGQMLFAQALATTRPLVVDADALNLLAQAPRQRANWVLTPHPGEAGRLLGKDTAAVQADRYRAADELVRRYSGVVVLKGAGSLVAAAGEPMAVCEHGNPGMAAPGMGDTLTGLIAALIAQGFTPHHAARAGVYLHAVAGDRASLKGERGLLARDLIAELRGLVNPP